VAGDAFVAGTASLVMGVLFERRCEGSVGRVRSGAIKANGIGWFSQKRIITRAVSAMARET